MDRKFILFNGYGQRSSTKTGMGRIAKELSDIGENATLYSWRANVETIASHILDMRYDQLFLIGYSYGGATAVKLCRSVYRMDSEYRIQELVLDDAVYQVWQRMASWRSLLDHWTLTVPPNPRRCTSWIQNVSKPSGHRVIVDGKSTTLDSRSALARHAKMDDLPAVREHILGLAK